MQNNNFSGQNFDKNFDKNKEEQNNNLTQEPVKPGIGKGQKIAVIFLAFFAVLIMLIWAGHLQNSISKPFEYNADQPLGQERISAGLSQQEQTEEQLRSKDTDKDGLSDWDELNYYLTSPYLEDSDSDGFSDKEEINTENDPNCPVGKNCFSAEIIDNSPAGQDNAQEEKGAGKEAGSPDITGFDLESILGKETDAQTLRELLIEYGMDKALLDQISDKDLLKSYEETLGEM